MSSIQYNVELVYYTVPTGQLAHVSLRLREKKTMLLSLLFLIFGATTREVR
jgi:hypothetical protein